MDKLAYILTGIVIVLNVTAFIFMFRDKQRAGKQKKRIAEVYLFLWAICLSSLGILAGMLLCRHKIRKWYFLLGIFFALIQNFVFLTVIVYFLLK